MFSAVLLMMYRLKLPACWTFDWSANPASPLVTFTMTLRRPFSSSGRYTCEMSAGAATFVSSVFRKLAWSNSNASSIPGFWFGTQSDVRGDDASSCTDDACVVVQIVEAFIA